MEKSLLLKVCTLFLAISVILGVSTSCTDHGTEMGSSEETSGATENEGNQTVESGSGSETDESSSETDESSSEESSQEETNTLLGDEVEYASSFTVSNVFDSNMVVQRNEYVRVWGWADESENGKKVSATFMGKRADALIENGEWEIVFRQKFAANTSLGNDLVVFSGDDTKYVFENILIGDVFMVIGQSNVQYNMGAYLANEPELKWTKELLKEDSIIRYNYNSNTQSEGYPVRGTVDVCVDAINDFGWVKPDESNIDQLSAIGYFIAHQIAELTENQIPVGISQFSANGRPLSVFLPNHLAEQYESDRLSKITVNINGESEEREIYVDPNFSSVVEARYMYNHYLNPFERMPIAGIVWYQGEAESKIELSSVYVERFTALIEYMRSTHNLVNKEFPVFFVEYPSVYKVEGSDNYLDTGRIRANIGMIPNSLSNSYVAVCSDLWDDTKNDNNIHPYCKYEQAERVTDLMQAVIYGTKTLDEATGPILESYELSSNRKTLTLKFSNYGEGLTTCDGGTSVIGFCGLTNKNDITAKIDVTATITAPDTITITFSKASCGVAYNCVAANFFGVDVNLCDSYGNPAKGIWIFVEP